MREIFLSECLTYGIQSVASRNQRMGLPHETGRKRNDANDDKIVGQAEAKKSKEAQERKRDQRETRRGERVDESHVTGI